MKTREQFFQTCMGNFVETYPDWNPSMICRYCSNEILPEELDLAASYWKITGLGPLWSPCHKSCLKQGYSKEAYDCQNIDRDCNDCRHFVRDKTNKGREVFSGICLKFASSTIARPNCCSDRCCFSHRKIQ